MFLFVNIPFIHGISCIVSFYVYKINSRKQYASKNAFFGNIEFYTLIIYTCVIYIYIYILTYYMTMTYRSIHIW